MELHGRLEKVRTDGKVWLGGEASPWTLSELVSNLSEPASNENSQPLPLWKRALRVAVFVALGGLVLWGAFSCDAGMVARVREDSNGAGRWLAGRVSYWGDWYGVLALGLGLWWFAKKAGSPALQRLVLVMGLCAALSGLSANVIRAVTGRARPFSAAAPGWYGPAKGLRVWTKGARDFQSFPSAHTSVVAGFFAPLALVALRHRRRGGVVVALLGTGLMAWARVWVGAHHLSDVMAAALLGLATGLLLLKNRRIAQGFAFLPPSR